jgi:hypothetical protein
MKNFLNIRNASKEKSGRSKIKIHTISMMLGGTESANERIKANEFLENIAKSTNGTFRMLDDFKC